MGKRVGDLRAVRILSRRGDIEKAAAAVAAAKAMGWYLIYQMVAVQDVGGNAAGVTTVIEIGMLRGTSAVSARGLLLPESRIGTVNGVGAAAGTGTGAGAGVLGAKVGIGGQNLNGIGASHVAALFVFIYRDSGLLA